MYQDILFFVSPGTLVSFTNKTDRHDTAEILLKVAVTTINHDHMVGVCFLGMPVLCYTNNNTIL
jgi:hypothetical protein